MSLKDDLKKLKERLDKDKPKEQPKPEAPPKIQKESKPPKENKPPKTEVVYKCGHTQLVGELKNHDCRACQKKTLAEKSRATPGARRGKGKGRSNVARLPWGSRYSLAYYEEGDRKWWYGELTIPLTEQSLVGETFTGEADSVHYLLDMLGKKFRDWEREEAAKRAESITVIPPECST